MQISTFLISPNARIYLSKEISINYIVKMQLENYKLRIFDLFQRWRMGLLNEVERNELETWFRSLEDCSLGVPTEMSVDQLEKRLHQLFGNPFKEPDDNEGPPYPFK